MRLLIVDDDPDITELAAAFFRGHGHDVDVAQSGNDALALAGKGRYDAALLDLMMPRMNGVEVVRRMRELEAVPPVLVAMTGREITREHAKSLGFTTRFIKPFRLEDVASLLPGLVSSAAR